MVTVCAWEAAVHVRLSVCASVCCCACVCSGPFVSERNMPSTEDAGFSTMYEAGSLLASEDGS